jgi:hypothetical protein
MMILDQEIEELVQKCEQVGPMLTEGQIALIKNCIADFGCRGAMDSSVFEECSSFFENDKNDE